MLVHSQRHPATECKAPVVAKIVDGYQSRDGAQLSLAHLEAKINRLPCLARRTFPKCHLFKLVPTERLIHGKAGVF